MTKLPLARYCCVVNIGNKSFYSCFKRNGKEVTVQATGCTIMSITSLCVEDDFRLLSLLPPALILKFCTWGFFTQYKRGCSAGIATSLITYST